MQNTFNRGLWIKYYTGSIYILHVFVVFFKFSIRIYLKAIINFKFKFAKLVIFRKKKILQKGLGEQISMYTVQYAYHCLNPPNRAIYMLILEERGR